MVHHLKPPFRTPPPPEAGLGQAGHVTNPEMASELAVNRAAYSLAREVLCLRAELKAERDQAIHNLNLFETASKNHQAAHRRANELERTLEQMDAEEGQEILALREQLDEAQTVAMQMTSAAINLRNQCKEYQAAESAWPRPRAVRRTGDQSLELTFHSCRQAGEFERFITAQREMPA